MKHVYTSWSCCLKGRKSVKLNSILLTRQLMSYRSSLTILLHPHQKMQEKILKMVFKPIENSSGKSRKIYNLLLLIFLTYCFFQYNPSYSQPDSLYNYLEIAAKSNPVIKQKFSEYEAALQKIPQAGSLSDPELSLGVFLSPMEVVNGRQIADIRLMQMFPWFGVLRSAKDEMSLMANSKYEVFLDAKLQVFYDVQRSWYELYKTQKEIAISEKNIEILKIIEQLALFRFKTSSSGSTGSTFSNKNLSSGSIQTGNEGSSGMQGMGVNRGNTGSLASNQTSLPMQTGSMGSSTASPGLADLYRIEIESGDLENFIALLKSQRNSIISQFNSYLNRPADSPVFTPDTITIDSTRLSLITLTDSMVVKNPMLVMLEYEKQSIEARRKMVSRMSYPMVGLGVSYSLFNRTNSAMADASMNGKDMIMPMLTVTLPVYRKKYTAMQEEAGLLKKAVSQNYQVVTNSLMTEYNQAVQLYKDAMRRIKLYNNQYQLAKISFNLILKSFEVSSSGLSDVLRMRQQTLDYELKQVEAAADYNIAVAWLGRLGNLEMRK